jgi:hypothetical protein
MYGGQETMNTELILLKVKFKNSVQALWYMPIIPATQEVKAGEV